MAGRRPAMQRVRTAGTGVLPLAIGALIVGLLVGVWVGSRGTSPSAHGTASPTLSPLATPVDVTSLIQVGHIAPDLLQAYFGATINDGPVVCTTGPPLACRPAEATRVLGVQAPPDTVPAIPAPDAIWPDLTPVPVSAFDGDVIVAMDLSPAILVQASSAGVGTGYGWAGPAGPVVSANGDVWFVDMGGISSPEAVILVRAVYAVPPDSEGLVESWMAIGAERTP